MFVSSYLFFRPEYYYGEHMTQHMSVKFQGNKLSKKSIKKTFLVNWEIKIDILRESCCNSFYIDFNYVQSLKKSLKRKHLNKKKPVEKERNKENK